VWFVYLKIEGYSNLAQLGNQSFIRGYVGYLSQTKLQFWSLLKLAVASQTL